MLESKLLRGNIGFVVEQLKRRNFSFDVDEYNELENQRKIIQVQTQELQNLRNTKSKSIGQAKASGENIEPLLEEVSELGDK
ncbi:MAG: serine--tRNA ligase, partial [Candidatus Thioglobus sp.]|nr:serine--tRNA ligase [Candidatus Thioglobus sp.]